MKIQQDIITLRTVSKAYTTPEVTTHVLKDVSLSINRGAFIAITGPSGSGKSTLMNILGLLDTPSNGTYMLNGKDVTRLTEDQAAFVRNRQIGFVFQSFNLLQKASALENVLLPAIYANMKKHEREEKARSLLNKLGLTDRMHNRPTQLSGGQQQRVAIARALMNNPDVILADEPTGNLDTKSGQDVMKIFKDLNTQGKTIILITHESDIAKQAEKIIHIKDGGIVK